MIDKSLRYNYQWGGPGGKSPGTSSSGGSRGGGGPPGGGDRGMTYSAPAPAPAPAPSPHRDPTPVVTTAVAPPSILSRPTPSTTIGPSLHGGDVSVKEALAKGEKTKEIRDLIAQQQEEKFGDTADPTKFGETISKLDVAMSKDESDRTIDDKLAIEEWENEQDWEKVEELADRGESFEDIQSAMNKGLLLKEDAIRRQGLIERGLAALKPTTKLESSLLGSLKKTFDPRSLAKNFALRKMGLGWLNPLMGLASLFGLPQKAKSMIASRRAPAFDPAEASKLGLYADRQPTGTKQFAKRVGEGTIGSDIVAGKKGILESGQELLGLKGIERQQAKVVGPALIQMRVLEKKKGMSEVGGPELTPDEERKLDKLKEMDKEETIYRKAIAARGGRIDKPLTGRSRDI
jgi:hypothetical protein